MYILKHTLLFKSEEIADAFVNNTVWRDIIGMKKYLIAVEIFRL